MEPVESLVLDVDTPGDLADLARVLATARGVAPRTRGALRQLERVHPGLVEASPPAAKRAERAGEKIHA